MKSYLFMIIKIGLFLLLLGAVFASTLSGEKKVCLGGEPLSVLGQFEGKDWRGEKSWGFITSIGGEEKSFEVYPGVFEALLYHAAVEINLADIDDQFGGESDKIEFEHLGKTKEAVHIFSIFNHSTWISHLLFVEFEKNQGASLHDLHNDTKDIFYKDQVLMRRVGKILLGPGFYHCEIGEENMLKIGAHTFNLYLTPPSLPELVLSKFPFYFDRKPFISPILVDSYISSPRTGDSSIIAQDLAEAEHLPEYCTEKDYSYIYEGMATNGVHIVKAINLDAHPARIAHQFFLYEKDYELNVDWEKKTITRDKRRILLKKVGELGPYLSKPFVLTGNTISYTTMHWENMPFTITGPVEYIDKSMQIELKTP